MTNTTAAQPLDLNKLSEICSNWKSGTVSGQEAMIGIAALIAQARGAQPVQAGDAVDPMLRWAIRELLSTLPERRDWFNPDAERVLRASLAPVAAQPSLAAILNCYSPDDTASDYQDKIRALYTAQQSAAEQYLNENASSERDTGATVFHYGAAGRDYYNTLTELAEDLRNAAPASAQPDRGVARLVTMISACKAINHISLNNGPGRLAEATKMLAEVPNTQAAPHAQPVRGAPDVKEAVAQGGAESVGGWNG